MKCVKNFFYLLQVLYTFPDWPSFILQNEQYKS
jgi:hypothetical protein